MDFLLGNAEISVGLLSNLLSKMFNRFLKYIKRRLASFVYRMVLFNRTSDLNHG